jgi:hypothetical protein
MSHQDTIRLNDLKAQARLLGFLEQNSEWLAARCYEAGLAWLGLYYDFDPRLERALEADAGFWKWWKNDWRHRDSSMSSRLKVVNTGVLTYTTQDLSEVGGGATMFFHEPAEFRPFYLATHTSNALRIKVPQPVLEAVKRKMRQEALAA